MPFISMLYGLLFHSRVSKLNSEQYEPENLCTRTGSHVNFHHSFWYPIV